jgi:hypothetical protein
MPVQPGKNPRNFLHPRRSFEHYMHVCYLVFLNNAGQKRAAAANCSVAYLLLVFLVVVAIALMVAGVAAVVLL